MKKYLFTAFVGFGSFLYCMRGNAQIKNRDSVAIKLANNARTRIGLTETVFDKVLTIEKLKAVRLGSLDTARGQTADQRRTILLDIQQQYHSSMHEALTSDQWRRFIQLEAAARDSFLLRMGKKNIRFKELGQ